MTAVLRRLSLRYLAAHRVRTVLTVLGVALGMAPLVATQVLNAAVSAAFARAVERIAGQAALEITNGSAGVPEELVDEVRAVPGVRVAAPSVQGFVALADGDGERLYVLGVDLLVDGALREYEAGAAVEDAAVLDDPLVFLAQPDSVALTTAFLAARRLELGQRLRVRALDGTVPLTVRAAFTVDRGPASLFGGRVAVMDVFAAQRLFGVTGRMTQIDVTLAEGVEVGAMAATLRQVVAGRGVVERPVRRREVFDRLRASNAFVVRLSAVLGVVTGLYVVFNTMMMAVAERRREIALLRAAGMRRRDVVALVAGDALVLAAAGGALGLALGAALARGSARVFAASVSGLYLPVEVSAVHLTAEAVLAAGGLGLAVALLAALVPAWEAVRVRPVEALRPRQDGPHGEAYARAAAGGVLVMAAGVVLWTVATPPVLRPEVAGGVALLCLLVGASLIVPFAVRRLARRSELLTGRLLGTLGVLASRSIASRLGRLAVTSAAFVASVAGAVAIATLVASLERSVGLFLDGAAADLDLLVRAGREANFADPAPLPGTLVGEIAGLPDVTRVLATRITKVSYAGSLIEVDAVDVTPPGREINLTLVDGDGERTIDAVTRGEAVVVSELFARRFGVGLGDQLSLATASGPLELPVAGISADLKQLGVVHLDRGLYRRRWRDETVSFVFPVVRRGADPEGVAADIRRRWGETADVFVTTTEALRRESQALLGQAVAFTYPLIAVSIVVALLGVVNSLSASVIDRLREIGLLRAVGATRRQVVRVFVSEAGLVGAIAGALGVVLGSVLGYPVLRILVRDILAMTIFYRYPTAGVLSALLAAAVLSALAGYLPGRAAARLRIGEALDYE